MARESKRAIVIDASAFIAGFDFTSTDEEHYTVPEVIREISGNSIAHTRVATALDSGKLKVKAPQESFVRDAITSATLMGDTFFLSKTDLKILALALELAAENRAPLIVTDDYSIQNVAEQSGMKFAPLATFGIRSQVQWVRYCPACYQKYPANYETSRCNICDTKLKRKALGSRSLEA